MQLTQDYAERVYAGVLGKVIGVYLGRPFEGWTGPSSTCIALKTSSPRSRAKCGRWRVKREKPNATSSSAAVDSRSRSPLFATRSRV